MKRLIAGFTLAEILITLGIIGVVARVTLPALMANVSSKEITTSLAKSINSLEVGNKTLLASTNARNLSSLVSGGNFNTNNYLTLLSNSMNGTLRTNVTAAIDGADPNGLTTFTTKDGIMFTSTTDSMGLRGPVEVSPSGQAASSHKDLVISRSYSSKYSGQSTSVLVDINGKSSPNKLGTDQFVLYVDSKGAVIPYGGIEYSQYALDWYGSTVNSSSYCTGGDPNRCAPSDRVDTSTYNSAQQHSTEALWKNYCKSSSTSASDRAACTGSIVDNGYNINY